MTDDSVRVELVRDLQAGRDALLWKLEGLPEYEVRRPMTATGTNLLGLVKHVAFVELGYFGAVFDRPVDEARPWIEDEGEPNWDMWATAEESREDVLGLYHRAWELTEATIEQVGLAGVGRVPWWREGRREVTLHQVLVHVIAETHRHAGHADIVRELIDGAAGLRAGNDNLPDGVDAAWWSAYRAQVERAAEEAAAR
jgi:uncharacterized damage-inducible protein DinB